MNVLSLFDGISCGQVALNRANIAYDNYFASEIDKKAISVTQHHYPKTIQLGDARKVNFGGLPPIDLLIGGSPCQDLSRAKKGNEGLAGNTSNLFYEYVRALNTLKPKFFLFENVETKDQWRKIIDQELGVESININSSLVSAARRNRWYWTNIPVPSLPVDKNLVIKDIVLHPYTFKTFTDPRITKTKKIKANQVKWDLGGKGWYSQQDRAYFLNNKMCCIPHKHAHRMLNIVVDLQNDIYRRIHPIEVERMQNLPDDYTNLPGITGPQRIELVGNGWTVDVIAHIFKFMKQNKVEESN